MTSEMEMGMRDSNENRFAFDYEFSLSVWLIP